MTHFADRLPSTYDAHASAKAKTKKRAPLKRDPLQAIVCREILEGVHELLDARLAVGGLVLVDNALGHGLVELAVGGGGGSLSGGLVASPRRRP